MVNFLDVSEPEAATQMAQQQQTAQNTDYARMATNALVSQYGPEAADPEKQSQAIAANTAQQEQPNAIAAENAKNADVPAALGREAQLRAAYALQSAMKNGVDGGTAWDTIVGPNAQAWGLDPAHAAAMRQHLSQDPKDLSMQSVQSLIDGLAGPAKPEGAPENLRDASGQLTGQQLVLDERGGSHVVNAPEGTTFAGPLGMAGSPKPEQLPDGSWGYRVFDKSGHSSLIHTDGTPVQGITAGASQQRANAATENANTAAYSAGVRGNNSNYGAGPGAPQLGTPGVGAGGHFVIPPGGATQFSPAMGAMASDIVKSFPGTQITSGPRTTAQNQAAGGAANSAHLSGNAADFHIPPGTTGPQFAQEIQQKYPGAKVLYEGPGADHSTAPHVHVELTPQATPAAGSNAPLFDRLPPKGQQVALDSARGIVNSNQQLQSIDGQIDNIKTMIGPFSVGLAAATSRVPGTPAHNMQAALDTLRAQGLTSWLQSMKNSAGQTGIGRVLQSEASAAQASFGALDQGQTEDQFRYHLGIFQQRVHQLQTTAETAFSHQYGRDPYSALGVPNPTGGPGGPSSTAALRAKYGL